MSEKILGYPFKPDERWLSNWREEILEIAIRSSGVAGLDILVLSETDQPGDRVRACLRTELLLKAELVIQFDGYILGR